MVFQLTDELIFPDPSYANTNGLLAIGGDLRVERLLLAYENGIFPWYSEGEPILWYATNPRFVLFPDQVKVSKSMRKLLSKNLFSVTENKAFIDVMKNCAEAKRPDQFGTWITDEMIEAYTKLFELGFARSIEVWNSENELVGGLYGVELNGCFFGESMFHRVSNASKVAFIHLCQNNNYKVIDCQTHTQHLESLGAEMIDLEEFLKIVRT